MTSISKKFFWSLYFLSLALGLIIASVILYKFGFNFYLGGDSPGYMLLAKNLAERGILSFNDSSPFIPTNFRTPGYPIFLAIVYLLFNSFVPAIFFGAIIAAFSAPLIYLIAREIFSEKTAILAGFLTAIEPMGIFLGVSILTEGVFTPVLLLGIYFFIRYLKIGDWRFLFGSGAIFALSALIRPIMFYFWIFAIPFIIWKEFNNYWRLILKKSAIFLLIFFGILSPWLLRNKLTVNSWQITGMQGYIFFIDHYGAVLRYLGKAGPLSDVQNMALNIVSPEKVFTSEGSDILFKTAVSGIWENKSAYVNVYTKSLIAFFMSNGYKSLFIDILGIPAKAPYVPFESFLRFDFTSIIRTFGEMDFNGFLIYWGSKLFWFTIFLSFLLSLVFLLLNKNYKNNRLVIIFIGIVIFYFALITGPTAVGGGRTKAPINGLIFIFSAFGIISCRDLILKRIRKNI